MVPVAVFGFFYPRMRLKAAAQTRLRHMFRDMPYVMDLLTLSTEAGQDFSSAMATVVEKGPPGPLVGEFRIVHQEVTLGKTRADALRAMAERVDLTELTSFVLALLQAEQLGASVSRVLRTMSEQMRIKRSTLAEEMAGKVPVKLMAPLVICIFPASFIVLFVPLYLRAQLGGF
jgi:tight adherence protein C